MNKPRYIVILTNAEGYTINPTTYLVKADTIKDAVKSVISTEFEEEFSIESLNDIVEGQETYIDEIVKNVVVYSIDKAEINMKANNSDGWLLGKLDW